VLASSVWLLKHEHSWSTVGGGDANTAAGAYSFAAGRNGIAADDSSAAFGFQSGVDTPCKSLGKGNVNFCVTASVTVNGESVTLQSQFDSLQSQFDSLQSQIDSLTKAVGVTVNGESVTLQSQFDSLQSQFDSLQSQIDSLTTAASFVTDSGASTVVSTVVASTTVVLAAACAAVVRCLVR
jgi:hypothetical protein